MSRRKEGGPRGCASMKGARVLIGNPALHPSNPALPTWRWLEGKEEG